MDPAAVPPPAVRCRLLLATHAASVTDARLTVETPGPTRVYLTDGAGAPVTLPGVLAYHKGDEHHFIVPGRLEMESASGVKAAPLGYNRVYVRLDAPFSYAAWFRALKAGRSFATNGPLLFLTVDGHEPGAVVKAAGGAKLRVWVEAESLRPLERVEVIYRGGVIRTLRPPDTPDAPAAPSHLAAEFDFTPDRDGWMAARAFEWPGRTIRFSHTSPVYLERGVPARAADDARFFLDWIDREVRLYRASTGFRSEADRAAMLDFFAKGRAVYERLAR